MAWYLVKHMDSFTFTMVQGVTWIDTHPGGQEIPSNSISHPQNIYVPDSF
jgi:hypothetical protein